jgi:hypothetical protein
MSDVRLTALNPVDSQVYPVACNSSGELIVEQIDPGPDLTVTGDLTVDGTSTLTGAVIADGSGTFKGDVTAELNTDYKSVIAPNGTIALYGAGNVTTYLDNDGTAYFKSKVTSGTINNTATDVSGARLNSIGNILIQQPSGSTSAIFEAYAGAISSPTVNITADGAATFSGDITCSDNSKGLILKSPNGTSYRITVANDGTLSTV